MAKTLKLVGLKTYVNSATRDEIIKKGEVCRFDDKVADKVLLGGRINADHERVAYFTEVSGGDITHDFSTEVAKAVPETVAAAEAPAEPVKATQRRAR